MQPAHVLGTPAGNAAVALAWELIEDWDPDTDPLERIACAAEYVSEYLNVVNAANHARQLLIQMHASPLKDLNLQPSRNVRKAAKKMLACFFVFLGVAGLNLNLILSDPSNLSFFRVLGVLLNPSINSYFFLIFFPPSFCCAEAQ